MSPLTMTEKLNDTRLSVVPKGPFNTTPCFTGKAAGSIITDVDGREYIDFAGGIGVNNVGHCHPKVVAAIKDQAERYIHPCFHVAMYEPYVRLAEKLCAITPGEFPKMAMFANSGAEAVENAVKIARYHTKRPGIICFENGFHGRTLLTMTLTSKVMPYKYGFGPFAPEIYRMPFGDKVDAGYLKEFFIHYTAAENIAAVIAEPVQGEGGFNVPSDDFFPELVRICRDNGILFIADEIQSGMGRTGRMFAIEHWGVEPDIITAAKSLAGGMPLSAVIGRKEIMDASHVGGLGGTYGGNPVACRAALAVLEVFEAENLLEKAVVLGEKLKERFSVWQNRFEHVGRINGIGPMLAFELITDADKAAPAADTAKALVKYSHENGLILLSCGPYGNMIRTLMPLNIPDKELERGLAILEAGLAAVGG
ncbi:MAG: 4-aminobutyrate--2-oxoglutarate transaminase [Desulfobacteraceae bacterium]|nr:4-aminobutyrate--2-oxoglutarate transaminase [Desulfobacteraceae bacterium]